MGLLEIIALIALLVALPPGIKALVYFLRRRRVGRWLWLVIVIPLIVAIVLLIVALLCPGPDIECSGKPGSKGSFSVDGHYAPSGKMGDTFDITILKYSEVVRFTYDAMGRGPHEWDYKYIGGEVNPQPAQFGGVMYLDPPNNWGWCCGGFDLRGTRDAVKWEARSLNGPVNVEFVIGGVVWGWDDNNKERVTVPYPDSMPRNSLGVRSLTEVWQLFELDLSQLPEDHFKRVVAGFGWVIDWGSNGIQLNEAGTGPVQPETFEIEIRNVRYER